MQDAAWNPLAPVGWTPDQHWILNPQIRQGLCGLPLLAASVSDAKTNFTVVLRSKDGKTSLDLYQNSKNRLTSIHEIDPNEINISIYSHGINQKPTKGQAPGLFIVCEGEHIGKLICKFCHEYEVASDRFYYIMMEILVTAPLGKGTVYVERFATDSVAARIKILPSSLGTVHTMDAQHKQASKLMRPLWEKYNSNKWIPPFML